jgi:hypothetical protein
MQCK